MSEPPDDALVPPWDRDPPTLLLETRVFSVSQHSARSRLRDHSASFVVIDCPDWVNVIARTTDGHIVLIEQYRHGTDEVTVEIPGGMVDPGEDAIAAGLRELAEETGYRPSATGSVHLIGAVSPNPAIQSNLCSTVLVDGLEAGPASPDENEEIGVRLVPEAQLGHLVRSGEITHSLVVAAFHHLHLWSPTR